MWGRRGWFAMITSRKYVASPSSFWRLLGLFVTDGSTWSAVRTGETICSIIFMSSLSRCPGISSKWTHAFERSTAAQRGGSSKHAGSSSSVAEDSGRFLCTVANDALLPWSLAAIDWWRLEMYSSMMQFDSTCHLSTQVWTASSRLRCCDSDSISRERTPCNERCRQNRLTRVVFWAHVIWIVL